MNLWRSNSYIEIFGASESFLARLSHHLCVPVADDPKLAHRFGSSFVYEGQRYASLVHGNRVASGLLPYVTALAEHYREPYDVRDLRIVPEDRVPWWSLQVKSRPYQEGVQKRILECGGVGVIDAPPRAGKTLMAMRAIDTYAVPTVYLAPSLPIVRQTYEVMKKVFGDDFVSRLDGDTKPSERDITKPIVIATAASASRQPREWWDTRELLIIDEFHHAAAETYHLINDLASNCYYRLCFTGTHFRTGDDGLAMDAICSQVLYTIPVEYLIREGFLTPPRVAFMPVLGAAGVASSRWESVYRNGIVQNAPRNLVAARLADHMGNALGLPTIVLVRQRAHADELGQMIPGSVVVKGGETMLTNSTITAFREGSVPVIIGTSVIGEGVDVPTASVLIYAAGGNPGVQMMQSYFRPLTAAPGKTVARIYDFMDENNGILQNQSQNRLSFARARLGSTRVTEL